MKRSIIIGVWFLSLFSQLSAQDNLRPVDPAPNYIVLKNAYILDMLSSEARKGNLLLKDDKIEQVDYSLLEKFPSSATIYNFEGKYIMPGLIDAHVHITHGTFEEAARHLQTALQQGVTGVRDMGGDGRMLTLLKKNMLIGESEGPDVFFSTIIAGPSFFEDDPRPQSVALGAKAGEVSWQRAITHDSDFKQIVAEAKGLGATAIKMYANLDQALMEKVSVEAQKQGLKVWAHAALPPTRPSEVAQPYLDVMSHAGDMVGFELMDTLIDRHAFRSREEANQFKEQLFSIPWDAKTPKVKALFQQMKQNNIILDATIFVYYFTLNDPHRRQLYKERGIPIKDDAFKNALKVTELAYNMGVKIGAGSDHMINDDGRTINIHKEIELLVEAGLTPIDALRAATIINAEGLGEEANIGSIEPGKLANLLILNQDPLEDISHTRSIRAVVKRGKMID